jgi:hypothetical protein
MRTTTGFPSIGLVDFDGMEILAAQLAYTANIAMLSVSTFTMINMHVRYPTMCFIPRGAPSSLWGDRPFY